MTTTPQFDVAKAALEHLELLNCSNQNPLEIAAQFRTLLRSKKTSKNVHPSNIDYTYTDYITADATIRRRGRCRSKSFGKIQYNQSLSESYSSNDLSKYQDADSSTEDISPDSAVGSDSSDNSNRFQYPTINWKQLREKQYEHKLDKVKQFISTKFKAIRLSRRETTDLTRSSSTTISDQTESCTYSNISEFQKNFDQCIPIGNPSRSRSSSNSIRTPSISPTNSPRPTYTISRLNSTSINQNNDDILFPIADCNLVIKHKPIERIRRISHREGLCN
jgi:hypothetical protein